METRTAGVRLCGVLNIIAGCAGGLFGLVITMVDLHFGGFLNIGSLALLLAGVLSVLSGMCLLFAPNRARSVAIGLLALAVVLGLTDLVLLVLKYGRQVVEGDFFMFTGSTGLVLSLTVAEIFYLWRQRSVK